MKSSTESIADELRNDILDAVYPAGERLVEMELCDRYDCGRAVARAALVQLETEGLVQRQLNRGAVVRRVSVAEAVEVTEARAALESLVAARAARNADHDERRELEDIIAQMRVAVAAEELATYSELNRLLHERIREISRHDVAAKLIEMLRNRAVHHQFRLAMMPGRPGESLEQHADIVRSIAAGDADGASVAMAVHLGSVVDVLNRWGDAS